MALGSLSVESYGRVLMIRREAWYQEANSEAEYKQLVGQWARGEHNPELAERIFRLHQRLGKDPKEIEWLAHHLEWEDIEDMPEEILPPVSFQIAFRIERYVDSSWYGTLGQGFVAPDGEVEREATPKSAHTMSVKDFFDLLENEDFSDFGWEEGGWRLSLRGPSLEMDDFHDEDDVRLQRLAPRVRELKDHINFYHLDPEDMDEDYIEEYASWKTTLVIQDANGKEPNPGGYLWTVLGWAKEANLY